MEEKKYSDLDIHDKAPTFDELVAIIEKNFRTGMLHSKAFTDDEIESGWQRYKTLNHLWQDEPQTGSVHRSQILQEYKQYKENLKYLGGASEWTYDKVSKLNKQEVYETIIGFNDLITFLDSTCYAYEEGAKDWEERALKAEARTGPVWVKASDLKIEYGKNYYAQWLDGKLKATGWFQESDGTFFWNVPGYIPIGKHEYERLSILDESAPSGEREVGNARYELSLALRSILRMIRHMPLKRDEQKRYEAAEAMLNKHASIYDVLRTESKEGNKEIEISEAFIEWACLHYTPYYKGNELVAWKGYVADGDEIGLTTAQLYDIFKQQKEG